MVSRLHTHGGRSSSGLHTPYSYPYSPLKTGLHTHPKSKKPSSRSPGYYFDKLKGHVIANEDRQT
ncbi:hypothetical protein EON65_34565 [archaeon]|nr:MAG: hypothetical protein EON65_34565 [archaeon]